MFGLLLTLATWGGVDRFDSWIVERMDENRIVAMTTVPTGGSFGQICQTGQGCAWTIVLSGSCTPGDSFPALATSSATALTLELKCEERFGGGMARFSFAKPERVDALLANNASSLGIAVPLQGDQIRVMNFKLSGLPRAIEQVRKRNDRGN